MGAMAQRVYDADSRWTNTGINVFCDALTKLLTIEMVDDTGTRPPFGNNRLSMTNGAGFLLDNVTNCKPLGAVQTPLFPLGSTTVGNL
jgi:hypothetical protein